MNDRDIVILFGAGASYGAGHVLPQVPPLGPNLYDALAAQYPDKWGSESHLGKMWAGNYAMTLSELCTRKSCRKCPRCRCWSGTAASPSSSPDIASPEAGEICTRCCSQV